MPVYEYMTSDGRRHDRICPYPPPQSLEINGEEAVYVPSAPRLGLVSRDTDRSLAARGSLVWEPGMDRDIERKKQYKEEKRDRDIEAAVVAAHREVNS